MRGKHLPQVSPPPGYRSRVPPLILHQYILITLCKHSFRPDSDLLIDLHSSFTNDPDAVSLLSILTGITRGNRFQGFYMLKGI